MERMVRQQRGRVRDSKPKRACHGIVRGRNSNHRAHGGRGLRSDYHGKRHSCRKVHKKISITGFYGINKAATGLWRLYLYVKREKLSILII